MLRDSALGTSGLCLRVSSTSLFNSRLRLEPIHARTVKSEVAIIVLNRCELMLHAILKL